MPDSPITPLGAVGMYYFIHGTGPLSDPSPPSPAARGDMRHSYLRCSGRLYGGGTVPVPPITPLDADDVFIIGR